MKEIETLEDDSKGRLLRIVSIAVVVVILLAVAFGIGYFTYWFVDTNEDDNGHETFSGAILDIAFRIDDPSTLDDDLVEMAITVEPIENVTDFHLVFFYGPEFNASKLYEDFQNSILRNPTIVGDVSFVPSTEDSMLIPNGYPHKRNNTYMGIELSY